MAQPLLEMRCGRVSSRCFRSPVAVRGAAADGHGSPSARRSPASCLCCAAGCRGRCYHVKWDAAQAARAGDAWWSGNGPASGVACMRPSSPSCADGDGSTSAGRWWTARRSARCAGKKLDRTQPIARGDRGYDSQPHRDRLAARGIIAIFGRRRTSHGSGLGVFRWVVERTLAWLHRFRRLAVRYERHDRVHHAFLTLGCALICWNYLKSTGRVF